MDVFSEIIVAAVDKVKNAVVKVDKYSTIRGSERITGSGSGFVFSSDGLILTNSHVIDNSDRLIVTLLDGSEFTAEVTGIDKDTDIAIIKIYGSGELTRYLIGGNLILKPTKIRILRQTKIMELDILPVERTAA